MITQEDTIFISGMDPETSEDDIAQHFGAIGVIKVIIEVFLFLFLTLRAHSVFTFFNKRTQFVHSQ